MNRIKAERSPEREGCVLLYTKKDRHQFYSSRKWREARAKALRRAGYMSELSLRYGKRVPADTVHHIFTLEDYPEYSLAGWNLIAVTTEEHNRLHDRQSGKLSQEGMDLMAKTAKKRGAKIHEGRVVLVVGKPGAGKTTYVQQRLADGICYDLDYIAAAFRLREPHAERHEASRKMAQDLLAGFAAKARDYSENVWIIRAAPTIDELEAIDPDEIIVVEGSHDISERKDIIENNQAYIAKRISEMMDYAQDAGIRYERIRTDSPPSH